MTVEVELRAPRDGAHLCVAVLTSLAFDLPGASGTVRRTGVEFLVTFKAGVLEITPSTLPPAGVSLQLAAPPVTGGGYLERVDPTRFRGAFAVDLGVVAVTAYTSLTLATPPSVLVLLVGEFPAPIQLSFGFTLAGVGGLVGVNRRVDQDAMSRAVGSGDAALLLFKANPDPARVLRVLDSCFPERRGDVVAGPILKVGWGTPTLVSATVAVLASGGGVTILGRLLVALPAEELGIVTMEVLVLGQLDDDGFSLSGALVNARFAGIPVSGELRLRLRGDSMALSAGGFHPEYPPPPGMTGMRRLTVDLTGTNNPMMRFEGYLAITPGTVQFGAAVHLRLRLPGVSIDGHGSFNALIDLDPFGFRCDFSANFHVEALGQELLGVSIRLRFSGPHRWELHGYGSVSILGFDVDIPINVHWGSSAPSAVAAGNPVEALRTELGKSHCWQTTGVDRGRKLVVLAPNVATDNTLVHPTSRLAFAQNAVPLDVFLSRFGGGRLPEPVRLTIATVSVGGGADGTPPPPQDHVPVRRAFMGSQFVDLDLAARLAAADFTSWTAGFETSPKPVGGPPAPASVELTYEDLVLGVNRLAVVRLGIDLAQLTAHIRAGAAARAALRYRISTPTAAPEETEPAWL